MERNENGILLSVRDLKVYFHRDEWISRALDGISYEVRKGETVCLVGESGCGKTVSALAILNLISIPPGELVGGSILFKGKELFNRTEKEMQEIRGKNIAMVFQEPMTSLNPLFTIEDQIREAITIHTGLPDVQSRKRCIQLLKDVGIPSPEERLKDYPHQLSGGQRQRVMIAMALACNPDLVIADEPTTALDVTIQAQILNLFTDLRKRFGMSLLYISHDLNVVKKIADRIYVMYAGFIVEQGSAYDIFQAPSHPYTMGLLESIATRDKRGNVLKGIPGTVPDPADKPGGCPFHPRCSYALESCMKRFPDMCDHGKGHLSRCPVIYDKKASC